MATRKVKRFNDGGDAETGGGANEPGTGGNISGGGGAFSGFGRDANERTYAEIDRSNIAALEANRALTAQENNMRDAQNLADYSAFDRDRSARYATEADAAMTAKSNNDNPNPSGFANFGGAYEGTSNDRAKGGMIKKYAKGGSVSSASSRGDGIAQRGKTKGRIC